MTIKELMTFLKRKFKMCYMFLSFMKGEVYLSQHISIQWKWMVAVKKKGKIFSE